MQIDGEFASRWVEALQTCELRSEPQNSLLVFDQLEVKKIVALLIRLISYKALSHGVETTQAPRGSGPKRPFVVDQQMEDDVAAQTIWIRRIVPVRMELSRSPVEMKQSVAICANPQTARAVFANRDNIGTVCRSGRQAVVAVAPAAAVDTVECCWGTNPQRFLTIFVYRTHKGFNRIFRTIKMRKAVKRRGYRIKVGGPHSAQTSPDAPLTIHDQTLHIVLREAIGVRGIVAVTDEPLVFAIEFEQTRAMGCDP